jgi:hypothetical protein
MRLLKALALVAAVCALAAVAAAGQKLRGARSGGVEIQVGKEKKVNGLRIAFERVAEDSRCPVGVVCVWKGNARALFSARTARGECVEFELNTGVEPFEYRLGDHTIRLAKLAPHPNVNRETKAGEYVATLAVSKAGKK